jgi:hypothetical protein
LLWWKQNHKKYSHVWQFAKNFLCVVASSAPSEHVFSVASLVVSKKGASLKPGNFNMIFTLRQNFDMVDWEPKEGM